MSADDEYAAAAEYYDFVRPYRERADVAFYVDVARESGGPVLDVGCGTDRVLIPTARAGTDLVGVDASARMLETCAVGCSRSRQRFRRE